eukprot:5198488-Amphidinium_carterae.1
MSRHKYRPTKGSCEKLLERYSRQGYNCGPVWSAVPICTRVAVLGISLAKPTSSEFGNRAAVSERRRKCCSGPQRGTGKYVLRRGAVACMSNCDKQ